MQSDSPVSIFLIDDDSSVRDSMAVLLKSLNFVLKSFASAEGFLNSYSPDQPGCLILDVKMPAMDGLELQEELLRRNIHIPIIFISGNAEIPNSAKAFRAGAVDFLEKPFDSNLLIARIHEALSRDSEDRKKRSEKNIIQAHLQRLTAKEKRVMQLLVSGHDNKEAAIKLAISPRTVEAHRARIFEKMQAKDIGELVTLALSYSLFS